MWYAIGAVVLFYIAWRCSSGLSKFLREQREKPKPFVPARHESRPIVPPPTRLDRMRELEREMTERMTLLSMTQLDDSSKEAARAQILHWYRNRLKEILT